MKRYIYFSLFVIVLFLFSGCLKDEKIDTQVTIKIELPNDLGSISKDGISVKLYNSNSGSYYVATTNSEGVAVVNAEYGFYDATVQYIYYGEDNTYIFNGRHDDILLSSENKEEMQVTIPLTYALKSNLVISEIYFAGCKTEDGVNYHNDNYIVIHNNSPKPAYLDSICIGYVDPMTSANKSNFVKPDGTLMDELPLAMMAWQVPGNGTDYLLGPGESAVIATNAVNHKARHANSVDLSKAKFAFYDVSLTMHEAPSPGVTSLNLLWKGSGAAYGLVPNGGPAMIMFRIPGNAQDYASDANNLQQDPVTHKGLFFLMIHKDWVIDGIECIQNKAEVNKRLTSNIDAGFICQEKRYEGLSVQRKVEATTNGRVEYKDTNNSSEDLEVAPATMRAM